MKTRFSGGSERFFFVCGFLSFWWTRICGLGDGGFGLRWVVVDGL